MKKGIIATLAVVICMMLAATYAFAAPRKTEQKKVKKEATTMEKQKETITVAKPKTEIKESEVSNMKETGTSTEETDIEDTEESSDDQEEADDSEQEEKLDNTEIDDEKIDACDHEWSDGSYAYDPEKGYVFTQDCKKCNLVNNHTRPWEGVLFLCKKLNRSIKKEAITTANTIEKVADIDLNGNSIECAKLTITDISVPFVLKNIMTSGKDYAFSLYIKNSNSSSIIVMGEELTSSTTWVRQYTSFTSTGTNLSILFKSTGTYYFYNMQLETGKICSDWTPNPQDVDDDLENATSIAQQAADKFSWIVKSGTSSSNFEITDRLMNLVSANINLDGVVSFMNTAKGDGRKNLYNLDYSSFENVASQEDAICYAKDNGVTSVGIDSSVSYDGDKSLKISYTTANLNSSTTPLYLGSSANNYGCVKVQAGKQYILSCYVKSDSTTGLFMIDIQGHDTPDTKTDGLYLSNIDPRKLPGSSTGVNLSTDWQRAICAIKVADNATGLYWSVVPLIWGRPSSSSAPQTFNVWVDCIMLEEVDSISNEPGTYILDKETIIDGGSIKTDTITGNQILAGSITADKIATDAIKSRNYISSGGTQGSFLNLSDGSFTSPNLSWDSNGNLIAKNANISGQITATKGSIAGWTIISDKMYTTGSGKYTGIGKYGSTYAFWAGATSNDNGNSAVFKVSHTGKLTAADADITGKINATSGSIGNWNIVGSTLYTSPSNNPGVGLSSSYDRYLMWAGETNGANGSSDSNAKFKVSYDGTLRVGASSTAIELVSGKLNLYSSSTYGDRIGSIHTVHKVDTDEYMFGIYSNFKYGWGLYHEDPTNEYVIADMYTRPNNQGVYMPRGFNVSYTDSSGGGQDGYFRIARISITGQYLNCPIELEFIRRGDRSPTKVTIRFKNSDSISPGIAEFYYEGRSNMEIYACDGITIEDNSHTLADIYVRKAEAWDNITVTNVKNSWGYMNTGLDINTAVEFYSSKPNVTHQAENLFDSGWVNCSMGYGISAYNSGSNIRVRKKNGIVFLEGVATNSTTWTEHDSIISFREDFAPARSCSFVMQGSGSNRWLLYVQPDGVCTASRYSNNETMSNTVPKNSWLCMNASWIAK